MNESDVLQQQLQQSTEQEITEAENEQSISSSASTPEVNKLTFESTPSEDGETLQELSCGSEINGDCVLKSFRSDLNPLCNSESQPESDIIDPRNSFNGCSLNEITEEQCDSIKSPKIRSLDGDKLRTHENLQIDYSTYDEHDRIILKSISHSAQPKISSNAENIPTISSSDHNTEEVNMSSSGLLLMEHKCFNDCSNMGKDGRINDETRKKENLLIINDHCQNTIEQLGKTFKSEKAMVVSELRDCNFESVLDELPCELSSKTKVKECSSNNISVPAGPKTLQDCNLFLPTRSGGKAPVPPPRRKRSLHRVAEKISRKIVEEAVTEAIKEATLVKQPLQGSCPHLPITEAVRHWLLTQGSLVLSSADSDMNEREDDDQYKDHHCIEEGECSSVTNQKNVEGNPFLAPYHSGSRQRVADMDESGSSVSSAGEWDMYDHESHTRAICDPTTSVDKYYRLGTEDLDEKIASTSHSMIKTAVHIRRTGPFPCGVCCIIQ